MKKFRYRVFHTIAKYIQTDKAGTFRNDNIYSWGKLFDQLLPGISIPQDCQVFIDGYNAYRRSMGIEPIPTNARMTFYGFTAAQLRRLVQLAPVDVTISDALMDSLFTACTAGFYRLRHADFPGAATLKRLVRDFLRAQDSYGRNTEVQGVQVLFLVPEHAHTSFEHLMIALTEPRAYRVNFTIFATFGSHKYACIDTYYDTPQLAAQAKCLVNNWNPTVFMPSADALYQQLHELTAAIRDSGTPIATIHSRTHILRLDDEDAPLIRCMKHTANHLAECVSSRSGSNLETRFRPVRDLVTFPTPSSPHVLIYECVDTLTEDLPGPVDRAILWMFRGDTATRQEPFALTLSLNPLQCTPETHPLSWVGGTRLVTLSDDSSDRSPVVFGYTSLAGFKQITRRQLDTKTGTELSLTYPRCQILLRLLQMREAHPTFQLVTADGYRSDAPAPTTAPKAWTEANLPCYDVTIAQPFAFCPTFVFKRNIKDVYHMWRTHTCLAACTDETLAAFATTHCPSVAILLLTHLSLWGLVPTAHTLRTMLHTSDDLSSVAQLRGMASLSVDCYHHFEIAIPSFFPLLTACFRKSGLTNEATFGALLSQYKTELIIVAMDTNGNNEHHG